MTKQPEQIEFSPTTESAAEAQTPAESPASRLCQACGLCCNGVLFHLVILQPTDSPKTLIGLGLKLKRKKKRDLLLQPCPAFCGTYCSIYRDRPERCRVFQCQQLQRIALGETTETAALEKIRHVQQKVIELTDLLDRTGSTNEKRPLAKRCEKILAEPIDSENEPEKAAKHRDIRSSLAELDRLLDADFRLPPIPMNAAGPS